MIEKKKNSKFSRNFDAISYILYLLHWTLDVYQGFWYFAEKKQNFAGFSGANSQKNWPNSWDFRGRKVKIRRKIRWFRRILAEKSQISKDFQEQILTKIGRFDGKFRGGNFAKK